ncbi:MAG: Gfo/Idh/MocA family oxidoreductase [Bryobacteraceae bacterium]|nr:Gfo/Idh/MocA family oxidoreductase [Bryobacteraceae bacterium]
MAENTITRRAAMAVAAGAPALLTAQGDVVRVAVIGVGTRGSHVLRQTLKVPGVKLVAIADINAETLARVGAEGRAAGHSPTLYADFRKMLDELKDIDAVIIATPVDTHKDIAIAALEVGKSVYLEKPMAATAEDCRMVTNAAAAAKGIFQLGFQLRHDPNRSAAIRHIHSGAAGRILYAQGYRHTGDLPRETLWYFDKKRSGSNIVEQACHILDLFTWAIGRPPLRAMGSGGINLYKDVPPGRTTMDNYSVIYEFPDDVRVNFSHIYFDPRGFSGIKERIYCSEGALDLQTATFYPLERRDPVKLETPEAGQTADYLSAAAFIDNVRGKRKPLNNAVSARMSTLVAILGRKAIEERRIVEWKEVDL